jgi:hypothetical protein
MQSFHHEGNLKYSYIHEGTLSPATYDVEARCCAVGFIEYGRLLDFDKEAIILYNIFPHFLGPAAALFYAEDPLCGSDIQIYEAE